MASEQAQPPGSYAFISYAHSDQELLASEIQELQEAVGIWYDRRITPGARWREEIAAAIKQCGVFLFYVSPRSVASEHCIRELSFALDESRPIIAVHVEETPLSDGLRFSLNHIQALMRHRLDPDEYRSLLTGRLLSHTRASPARAAAAPMPAMPRSRGRPAIAVLPFRNLGHEEDGSYFADGMAEDLITLLGREPDFPVISRSSSFQFRNRELDHDDICRELGARYLVQGSVRRSESRVRVTAQLVDGEKRLEIWSERYDREMVEVFDLQDELSAAILRQIYPQMIQKETARVIGGETLDAWELMLKGFWHENKVTADDNAAAKALFRAALEQDPSSLRAHQGLVMACYMEAMFYGNPDPQNNLALAEASMRGACEIAPDSGLAAITVGNVAQMKGNAAAAEEAYRSAISRNPNLVYGYSCLGSMLVLRGEHEEPLQYLKHVMELSPRDPWRWAWLLDTGIAHLNAGDFENAAFNVGRSLDLRPDWPYTWVTLAACQGHLSPNAEARATLARGLDMFGVDLDTIKQLLAVGTAGVLTERVATGLERVAGSGA